MDQIKIVNFERFNPRKDRKEHSWFRLDNTVAFSEDLFGLDADQKWFWIYLLSHESKRQNGVIDLNWGYLEQYSGVSIKKMKSAIEHFKKREMIQVVPQSVTSRLPDGDQLTPIGVLQTDNTDNTDNTNNTDNTSQAMGEVVGPADELMHCWNNLTKDSGEPLGVPKVLKLSDERKSKIKERLKKVSVDDLISAMEHIKHYPFLLGQSDQGWVIDFDWIIANDTNYLKIIEGKYRNIRSTRAADLIKPASKAQAVQDNLQRLWEDAVREAGGQEVEL